LCSKDGNQQPVEVLSGNQTELNPARRRSDRQGADQRALAWVERDGDIVLYPHSPLALADVLSASNGCFDLIADGDSAPADAALAQESALKTNASSSLQQRRQKKHPRNRANLLTQHVQEDLLHCCKRIQIENALVKQAGVKRLYLTAGFLQWKKGDTEGRAPVLFYPATLIRKALDADKTIKSHSANTAASQGDAEKEQFEYEIRLSGELPDTNELLVEWCQQNLQMELPEFSSDMPLQDYFAQLAQVISGDNALELQFDIALGNAAPPVSADKNKIDALRLPALPEHFDTSLAMAITGNKNLQQLHSVLNLLRDYGNASEHPQMLPSAANEAAGAVSNLHEYSKKLSAAGLAGVEFQHLPSLPENISEWVDNINKAMQSQMITKVLNTPKISARHLIRCNVRIIRRD